MDSLAQHFRSFNTSTHFPPHISSPLALLGTLWTTRKLYEVLSFTWLHFLRPSSLSRYLTTTAGEKPWALISGATDGIGKGFTHELAGRGCNLVLHGRTTSKLEALKIELQAAHPGVDVRILVLDAQKDVYDPSKMASSISSALDGISLRILINNIGGNGGSGAAGPLFVPFTSQSPSQLDAWLDISSRFPTQLTRQCLPHLTQHQPSLILNIGSGVSEYGTPFLSPYSGAKAYNMAFSRSLRAELAVTGADVECIGILLAGVATERSGRAASFAEPSTKTFAKACLGVIGSGHDIVWAYFGHHLVFGLLGQMPKWVIEKVFRGMALKMKGDEEKGEKAL
ncbi:hypothetical protein B0A48_07792 [Cryoendolithus antarcticus]|uniref:NAD(P)-binding protein n=1 Tax=Cryoendolithus antarcticus TaxID=1507870 RepID=A0A1V8T7R3_9PEZI|nr:hypothetical protein B0A48_07792 [Cryoendolithus antarcticus]